MIARVLPLLLHINVIPVVPCAWWQMEGAGTLGNRLGLSRVGQDIYEFEPGDRPDMPCGGFVTGNLSFPKSLPIMDAYSLEGASVSRDEQVRCLMRCSGSVETAAACRTVCRWEPLVAAVGRWLAHMLRSGVC